MVSDSLQKTFTVDNFRQEVISASENKLVLVHCLTPWCGPCRAMRERLGGFAEMEGIIIGELDFDPRRDANDPRDPALLSFQANHEIRCVPTVLFYKKGKEVARIVGAVLEEDILRQIRLCSFL